MSHATRKSNLGIFNLLGFACAIIFVAGFLKRSDTEPSLSPLEEMQYEQQELQANLNNTGSARLAESSKPVNSAYYTPKSSPRRSTSSSRSSVNVSPDRWIQNFEGIAMSQALEKGIPAGISLAMGIQILQSGVAIQTQQDFIDLVVRPLTHLKTNAPYQDRASYFKYAANSTKWADGLGASGRYSARDLKKILADYNLSYTDRTVRQQIVRSPKVSERKINYVANEMQDRRAETKEQSEVETVRHPVSRSDKATRWREGYEENVGNEVAKKIARKKLKSGSYITEEDMSQLIDEVNAETATATENKLMFMGRKINRDHKRAGEVTDISNKRNAQARGEKYQEYVKKKQRN
ncbi:MAG: hypothetical protein AAGI23_19315 [Bacteroidota bacterium]